MSHNYDYQSPMSKKSHKISQYLVKYFQQRLLVTTLLFFCLVTLALIDLYKIGGVFHKNIREKLTSAQLAAQNQLLEELKSFGNIMHISTNTIYKIAIER